MLKSPANCYNHVVFVSLVQEVWRDKFEHFFWQFYLPSMFHPQSSTEIVFQTNILASVSLANKVYPQSCGRQRSSRKANNGAQHKSIWEFNHMGTRTIVKHMNLASFRRPSSSHINNAIIDSVNDIGTTRNMCR